MDHGNTSSHEAFRDSSGVAPRGWRAALAQHPAQWQDRLHARLYFVRPLLRLCLAALWIGSALAGWFALATWSEAVAAKLGISGTGAASLLAVACVFDFLVGILVLLRWRPGVLAVVQVAAVLAYTVLTSFIAPIAWADPFGALLKNLPILAAILALAALEQDR
jgi:hypothetical protein